MRGPSRFSGGTIPPPGSATVINFKLPLLCVTLALAAAYAPAQAPAAQTAGQTPAAQQALTNLKSQALITKAEGSYNSGVGNYRAGHLDAARLDFDFAVDTMLTSGMDLKADGDLQTEFDSLLDRINSLEMAALKQGNGFSPKVEEAPLDTANDTTFPANPELVARLNSELNTTSDLPLVINDQVAGYIGVFSTSEVFRKHMAASLQRVGKYRGLIQSVLKEEGVPQDLIYLAVAEVGFSAADCEHALGRRRHVAVYDVHGRRVWAESKWILRLPFRS